MYHLFSMLLLINIWLFPVLTSGTAEETKEQKGSETVAGEGKRKK